MAPMRRRLSKRVVKSTFQECFEYDLPGYRGPEPKRANLSETRTRASISDKSKQESKTERVSADKNVNQVLKTKATATKENQKDEPPKKRSELTNVKAKESIKVKANVTSKAQVNKKLVQKSAKLLKIKKSAASRIKTKNAFLGSDYKRFKSPQIKTKPKIKTPVSKTKVSEENVKDNGASKIVSEVSKNAPSTGNVLASTNWQPVVHLEKITVVDPKSLRFGGKGKEISSGQQQLGNSSSKSPDLATRLRNALKDPLAEQEENESKMSDNEISNGMLVEEVPPGPLPASSQPMLVDSEDPIYAEGRNLRATVLESVFRTDVPPKKAESDSALEDWPESSSEGEDAESKDGHLFLDDIASGATVNDWSSPHVNVILHWQKKFTSVTRELRNSFDSLKNIIEEKNSLIAALKNKLDDFNDSTCHKILNRILLDYDRHDPKKPATMIINSILEYQKDDYM